jgi:hypothetical protein
VPGECGPRRGDDLVDGPGPARKNAQEAGGEAGDGLDDILVVLGVGTL